MAESSNPPEGNLFDPLRVRQLAKIMKDLELTEIDVSWENARLRLKRAGEVPVVSYHAVPPVLPNPAAAPASTTAVPVPAAAPPAVAEAKPADPGLIIRSPTVGTFYLAPSPDADPFVKVGSQISENTTVCMVEAMKVFNEIPAKLAGEIVEIMVKNGDPVEFNQPLFRVKTT